MLSMKTAGAVLLLLWSGQVVTAADSPRETCQPVIPTLLKEMSVLIAEQRVELTHTKTQLQAMETRLRASESKAEAMETRLRASESKAEAMETRLRASESKAEAMETRLRASESKAEAMETRLRASESKAEAMETRLRASESKAEAMETRLKGNLRREREQSRVSFSAALLAQGRRTIGPSPVPLTLVFELVFTNSGNAYNSSTGIFTAPIRGVYFFVVFVYGYGSGATATGVSLHKNGEHVVLAYAQQTTYVVQPSNGASLLLEKGDEVYVELWPNSWVHDAEIHHCTFSGHLLFPM
ncbi:hypothetical protein ACEWY4_020842 [Coilia grayii]|uniref:C1q domain-containing protein n=1 Tax=Coilia grayii TaxID=363190 RepID=A0ABD1J7L9_9TELE